MKQRFSKRTRLVSALLTLAMVFTFLPFSALAANTEIAFDSPDFALKFKDLEFQRFLKEKCDTNHNGKLDAPELSITEMTIPDDYKIKNLEGIRFFEDLEKLDCHGIGLTTLNVGKNFKLRELDCSYNQLKDYLYILSSGLKILNCSHNNLTSMDLGILSGLKLEEVDCSYNKIWRIVMRSEEELVKFDCSNNELMALDVSRCYQLKQLNCSVNQLVELDAKNQTNLTLLDCHHNELTELNVSKNQNLASLTCDGNQLTTLDLSKNTSLSHLSCAENRLACVDFSHMVGSTINADGNRHPIAVLTDGTFDLNTLPGFNVGKASNWHGGSVSGTILTVEDGKDEVSYQYDCGKEVKPTFIFETSLPINEKNFPDPNFRNYIKTYKAGGKNVLTVEQQRNVTTIEINNKGVSDLKGIEAFPNLTELDCGNNSIQKLDLRQNLMLRKLICNKNQLTQLDLSKNPQIYHLICSGNQLKQLDVSHLEDLVTLDCSHNDLEQLDVKNSKSLVALNCSWNRLTELNADVSHKSHLERVECQHNQLTSLILGQNKLLKKLNCAHNQLTQLNLDNMSALEELRCQNNQLTALDVSSSPDLTILVLKDNHLTSLNLDSNPKLELTPYTDIYHSDFNNVYTVTLNPDRTFDLRNLPGNFDVNRVTGWEHGKANGYILTVDEGTNVVYYAYKCRSDIMEVSFKLDVTGTGGSTGGGSTGGGSTGGGSTGGGSTGGGSTGGGSTGGGSTGGDSTIPPEAGKYQLTVTDGVATVNGITSDVLNVKPGDTVTLTADTTKFPESEEFGWWEITPYGSVSNTLTGQYQRTATFTMPNENVSARAMSKSAGVSTGGDDGGGGGGAAILLVGGAAVAGLVGYGVYSYVSEQQLKALLPEGVAMPENRAQTALLLWNTAGRPEPAEAPAFKDVADPDTAKAAQWCVEHGLMDQKLGGRFAPDNSDPAYKTLNAYQQLVG